MAFKVNIPEDMTGWSTGEGRAQRGIFYGKITLEDITTTKGTECWELKMTPSSTYVPVAGANDGSLEEVEGGAALSIYLWYPDSDDDEKNEREMRKLVGYGDAACGGAGSFPRNSNVDPVKVFKKKGKNKVAILWDPRPAGTKNGFDQHSPLTEEALEKLLNDEYKVRSWPQDSRVAGGGAAAAAGGKRGGKKFEPKGSKGKKKAETSDDEDDDFIS